MWLTNGIERYLPDWPHSAYGANTNNLFDTGTFWRRHKSKQRIDVCNCTLDRLAQAPKKK